MTVEPMKKAAAAPVPTAPHVVIAMNDVTAFFAGEGVKKGRTNQQQGYKFRGIDEILNALARTLGDNKLVIIPHVRSRELTERQAKSGGALFNVVVSVDYTFISALDGSRETIGPFEGEAMDSADKATNKAMSAAYKYMAIQTFCIPTEGDNDADATTHEVAPSDEPRQQRRSNVVVNPKTGKEIDTENANNQRKNGAWDKFTDTVRGYVENQDADGLRLWYTSDEVAKYVAGWVFRDQAEEHFESAMDVIARQ